MTMRTIPCSGTKRHWLEEARRAVQARAIEGVVENQKSESASSYTGVGRDFLACAQGVRKIPKSSA